MKVGVCEEEAECTLETWAGKKTLRTFDFSCGASTLDLDLPDELSHVHFRDLNCEDPVEKLYYSMGYDPICIYCASEDELETQEIFFPICASCKTSKCPTSKQWYFMFSFVSILTSCSYHVLFECFLLTHFWHPVSLFWIQIPCLHCLHCCTCRRAMLANLKKCLRQHVKSLK